MARDKKASGERDPFLREAKCSKLILPSSSRSGVRQNTSDDIEKVRRKVMYAGSTDKMEMKQ